MASLKLNSEPVNRPNSFIVDGPRVTAKSNGTTKSKKIFKIKNMAESVLRVTRVGCLMF